MRTYRHAKPVDTCKPSAPRVLSYKASVNEGDAALLSPVALTTGDQAYGAGFSIELQGCLDAVVEISFIDNASDCDLCTTDTPVVQTEYIYVDCNYAFESDFGHFSAINIQFYDAATLTPTGDAAADYATAAALATIPVGSGEQKVMIQSLGSANCPTCQILVP